MNAITIEREYAMWRNEFAKAMDPRLYTLGYLDQLFAQGLWTGMVRMFASRDAAIIAEIKTYPTGSKDVCGVIAAGDLDGIIGLIPLAEAWGREEGCTGAVIESREGWVRALKHYGYEIHQVAVRKVI